MFSTVYSLSEFAGTEELIGLNESETSDEYIFSLPITDKDILNIDYPGEYFLISFDVADDVKLAEENLFASTDNNIDFFERSDENVVKQLKN